MKDKILDVLRTNYPDKYEELHEVTADVLVLVLQSQLKKERPLTIGEAFAIEDENSIQYFVQGIDGLKSSMIHTKLKPITSNPK